MTNENKADIKSIITAAQGNTVGLSSEDVGHFKSDDYLELTRRAGLQTDHAYVGGRVIDVAPG
jgi:hypothetical protein